MRPVLLVQEPRGGCQNSTPRGFFMRELVLTRQIGIAMVRMSEQFRRRLIGTASHSVGLLYQSERSLPMVASAGNIPVFTDKMGRIYKYGSATALDVALSSHGVKREIFPTGHRLAIGQVRTPQQTIPGSGDPSIQVGRFRWLSAVLPLHGGFDWLLRPT